MLRSDGRRRGRLAAGERRERKRLPAAALASGVGIGSAGWFVCFLRRQRKGEDGREDQEMGLGTSYRPAFLLPVDLESRLIGDEDPLAYFQVTDAWVRTLDPRVSEL